MTKDWIPYDEQLKDRRWLDLRDEIVVRDFHMCQECMSGHRLQVHHKAYRHGKMAWEYPKYDLITLCDKCHKARHKIADSEEPDLSDPFVRLPYLLQGYIGICMQMAIKEMEKKLKEKQEAQENG